MIVRDVLGNIKESPVLFLKVDLLEIEWFEANKRIQRKTSNEGQEIAIKFMREGQQLHDGDIVFQDGQKMVVVFIKPCDAIVLKPSSMLEMGTICYEIGNKHLPLFIQDEQVMMPFEMPMFRWLEASGYQPKKEFVQLLNMLKSNVEAHNHGSSSLFNKILHLASSKE
jgi:urease accessory protein